MPCWQALRRVHVRRSASLSARNEPGNGGENVDVEGFRICGYLLYFLARVWVPAERFRAESHGLRCDQRLESQGQLLGRFELSRCEVVSDYKMREASSRA